MIVWRGYGILVPIIAFAALVLMQLAVDGLLADDYWKTHRWPLPAAAVIAGGVLWTIGRRVNAGRVQHWVDPASGLEFTRRGAAHSFFYVPMEWAGVAVAALGLLIAALPGG